MPKFKRKKSIVPKFPKENKKPAGSDASAALSKAQKNIYRQAGLAVLTIVLTIVILFAMTSAWYTNIVQTSGLVFEAEGWGFDGTIKVNELPIKAAPGDNGLIHLEVENNSDSISAISVNISKTGMDEEMQKRLFFYVDTQLTRNEETMNRVYLNAQESYTYTVFNSSWLTLTEERHNNAQLKWQWVYDVLGYYVLGQWTEAIEGTGKGNMTIMEYLRPIEYDYDEATTTFVTDEDGNLGIVLKTVDGETSVEDFLKNLSKTDGYEGTIDPSKKLANGFYPVDVDDDGYGVYAYLSNYTQIELATQYDTELGKIAYRAEKGNPLTDDEKEKMTHTATLTISAQKNENSMVNVNTLAALNTAITQGTADVIQLGNNLEIPEGSSLVIPENTRAMLDLNEHTIVSKSSGSAIKALPGSTLTMINGSIEGADAGYGIYTNGAEVVLSDVAVKGFECGLYLGDSDNNNALDSRVYLLNATVSGSSCAVFVSGNGSNSEQKTQLVIENSKLYSDSIVISGNGSATGNGRWGTDIQIINSEIISDATKVGAGIYQPQKDSTLTIYESTVSGYTGVAIKGGSVSITDSTISGKGEKQEAAFGTSGFADTGDAVYIETNYGYEILLEISGSTLTSTYSQSLQVFEPDATNVAVIIYSGTFDQAQPEAYIAEGSEQTGTEETGTEVKVTAGSDS